MNRDILHRTLERAQGLLLAQPSVEGALARREVGSGLPGDRQILEERLAAIIARQGADGSWDAGLGSSAAALLELDELADGLLAGTADILHAAVPRGLTWLAGRRGGPGRFGDGCTPVWHQAGLCEHAMSGFHAPADGDAGDPDSLVVESARATEAALRWGDRSDAVIRHTGELRLIIAHCAWPQGEALLKASSTVAALGALLRAPVVVENVRSIAEGIALLVRKQRADGTWHGVGLYDAVELLLAGIARGYRVPEVDAALARSAQLLVLTQKSNGSWGAECGARQPLVAWRVLRHATGLTAGLEPAAV